MNDFVPFPKIPRLRRDIIVTEKIDGTNAQIVITKDSVRAGSRNRWLTLDQDNYGFACWVKQNESELYSELGQGQHFGEWWGFGINRKYDQSARHFSLFNTSRWRNKVGGLCRVVPELYIGPYSDGQIEACLESLREAGSVAAPFFSRPEGVVVYMTASGTMHKVLLENDELPKGFKTHAERNMQPGEVKL